MFDTAEYLERKLKLSARMQDSGLSGIILTAETNIAYFSGFSHHTPGAIFARPYFQVISADGRSTLVCHPFLESEMKRTSQGCEVRASLTASGLPLRLLMDTVSDLGMDKGFIGMELGREQRLGVSVMEFRQIEAEIGQPRVTDASDIIWAVRQIKSAREIELLRGAAAITGAAFQMAFDAARPGASELDIAKVCQDAMSSHQHSRPGFVLFASPTEGYSNLARKASDRKLASDELLWIDMGAVYNGYWSDFCRAGYLGSKVPSYLADRQKSLLEVNDAMFDACRVGSTMHDIAAAGERALKRRGQDISIGQGRVGHGIGLLCAEPPHIALYDETVCEPGLVFTIEPRFIDETGVYNCEQIVAITADGPVLLTDVDGQIRTLS
jgi:Xaa-Pro aminopeptidase